MKCGKLFILIISITFLFSACNQSNEVEVAKQVNFDSPVFATIDYSDVLNGIDDATLTSDLSINSSLLSYSFLSSHQSFTMNNPSVLNIKWMAHYDFGKHLGLILKKLNLDDSQKEAVQGFMKTYHEGMKVLVKEFHELNKSIFEQARLDRKAIIDDLKAGKITRIEAGLKLKELNEKVRKEIASNPANENIKKQMCELGNTLFANIKSVLNSEQSEKWDQMIKRIKRPC
jgi:hypothetical protein